MIRKPELTQKDIDNFYKEFDAIVALAPQEIQKRWEQNNKITWTASDTFIIHSNVHVDFDAKLKDRFTILLNKIKNRSL